MILALCGTSEGRELLMKLENLNLKVIATVTTTYGLESIGSNKFEVIRERLNHELLNKLIDERGISCVIDITHPYAENISLLAIKVCEERRISYLRYERKTTEILEEGNVIWADSYKQAAEIASNIEGRIFLTVGSNHLPIFLKEISVDRLIARVLPTTEVIRKCEDYGFRADNIVAMKGPFDTEINKQMFLMYKAAAVVTKDSGAVGGTEEKIKACSLLGIPIIAVRRPSLPYPKRYVYYNLEELINNLKKYTIT